MQLKAVPLDLTPCVNLGFPDLLRLANQHVGSSTNYYCILATHQDKVLFEEIRNVRSELWVRDVEAHNLQRFTKSLFEL